MTVVLKLRARGAHAAEYTIIIEYFIKKGEYDIFTINEALFEFDQVLLG